METSGWIGYPEYPTGEMTHARARDLVRRAVCEADGGQWSCVSMRGRSAGEMYSVSAKAESVFNDPSVMVVEVVYDFQLTADGLDYSQILKDMIWEFERVAKEYMQ